VFTTVLSAGTEADAVDLASSAAAVVVVVIPKRQARADRREGLTLELEVELKVCCSPTFEWVSTGRIFLVRRDGGDNGDDLDCMERAPTPGTR
jgi:hypothetical protein